MPREKKRTAARSGPKPRGPFEGKRKTLTTRITERTRRRLDEASEATDRSLSQEIEFRLEESFQRDRFENAIFEALGGREHYPLLVMVGNAVRMVEEGSGQRWHQDFETAAQVKNAITTIIDAFSPKPGTEAERVLGGARGADSGMQVIRLAEEFGLVTTRTDESNQKD